ncbi:MAG TPA: SOS response-associated peptidase [Pyrinomonadaceae bacterium]|nr:SOS response-associated peptidase [Pyrinomonadaceae bacterium]
MCGRASQKGTEKDFKEHVFGFTPKGELKRPNIKPTQNVKVVVNDDDSIKTVEAAWWMQKEGAKEFNTKFATFNARAEGLEESFLYKPALKTRRCLVPVSSFYEWKVKGKPPVEIFTYHKKPFALAGLFSHWFDDEERKYSFTIITCEPNDFMSKIHNRMPVILSDLGSQEEWLEKGTGELLSPYSKQLDSVQLEDSLEKIYS